MVARGSGRAVFGVNASVSVALVVLVAAIALVVQPPAPPGIAAFAPQAAKPITKAPPGQSSVNGSGTGSCAAGQACAAGASKTPTSPPVTGLHGPAATTLAKGVPSALQCYTWPDGSVTQTFDPQSPPCIATWPEQANGNGGATSPGVTDTAIRVAMPQAASNSNIDEFKLLVQFFNTHYQLYGRRLVLVPFASQQTNESDNFVNLADPSAQHADAVQASSLRPFAATDFVDGGYASYTSTLPGYLDTLAQHHIMSLSGGTSPASTTGLDAHAPYEWSYLPTTASVYAGVAGLTCRQLTGHMATHALAYQTAQRKFAVLLPDRTNPSGGGASSGLQGMLHRLASCGVEPSVVYYKYNDSATTATMAKLRYDNVTTLLFYPAGDEGPNTPQLAAQNVGYFPEWVVFGGGPYVTANLLTGSPRETANTFGVASWNKILSPADEPWRQAFLLAGGTNSGKFLPGAKGFYEELQLLASGLQMAGPHLTPEAFAAALASTTFPNPGAGTAPSYQARVGFAGQTHEMMSDFAGFWFDPSATGADQVRAGSAQDYQYSHGFCYVDLGTRWEADAWRTQDRFLQGRCR